MVTDAKRPAIKDRSSGVSFFTGPAHEQSFARQLGRVTDRYPFSDEALAVTVSNRLGLNESALLRSRTVFGRFINRMMREDPNYIEFSGADLKRLLEYGGFDFRGAVPSGTLYLVRRDIVETCHAALVRHARIGP